MPSVDVTSEGKESRMDINKLRSVNEKSQLEALKEFYGQDIGEDRASLVANMKKISLKINPAVCLIFVIVYWVVGMMQYFAQV